MNLDIHLIVPKGNTWAFGYDQYGRLTNTSNPLGQAKTYAYDKMSRVTEYKDPAGNVTGYAYDALNRLTRKDIAVPSGAHSITDYTYDAVGNLLNISNGDSAVAYTYDALNRLTAIVNPANITVAFAYDAVGRRTGKKIFRTTPELLAEAEYEYDAAGQLLAITNKAGGKVVAFNKYQYDANGNRTRIEDQDGIWDYKYDAANRLIVALPWPVDYVKAEAFVYDKNGNRRYDKTAWDYHYDAANRLIENSTYTYTHDQNGNLTAKSNRFDNSQTTYAYTPEQQLSDVTTPEHKVQYKYDPLGRRTARTVDGRTIKFVYDGQDIIAELDDNNAATNTYTNGPGIDEPLIMTKADGKAYFYHADALGSIKAITDDSGKTIETYKYKAYGQPTIRNAQGQTIPTSLIGNNRMFAAREYEPEIALYNNRHRYLDPSRGAFTQEDPIGFVGGINLFTYAENSPEVYLDSMGLIINVGNALSQWNDAKSYLMQNDYMARVISTLEKSDVVYNIYAYKDFTNHFSFALKFNSSPTINWDPHFYVVSNEGAKISSKLALGHELIHAYLYDINHEIVYDWNKNKDFVYDNEFEKITIAIERVVASDLGEDSRCSHHGRSYRYSVW